LIALLSLSLASCAVSPPDVAPGTYANPVLERDFPDPAVLRDPDGWFYAYATQSESDGKVLNVQVARSRDLARWEHLGDALPAPPRWAVSKRHIWAPHVLHDAGLRKYFMYYSAEPDHARGKCLAVATADAPAGPFADAGAPLLCGEGIEHIDPMAFDDPRTGKRLLYWGSGGKPIKVQELAPDRMNFLPGSAPVDIVFPGDKPYRTLVEGVWVIYRDGTYFLFYSGDRCCSAEPRYAVMVARSRDALGPFEQKDEPILEASAAWRAPGHNSIASDEAGDDWILYHAFHGNARVMLLDRIIYADGWPRIAGRQPSSAPQARPAMAR
jgi:arabinan endo-1,5-alpha-L-arabinosidase